MIHGPLRCTFLHTHEYRRVSFDYQCYWAVTGSKHEHYTLTPEQTKRVREAWGAVKDNEEILWRLGAILSADPSKRTKEDKEARQEDEAGGTVNTLWKEFGDRLWNKLREEWDMPTFVREAEEQCSTGQQPCTVHGVTLAVNSQEAAGATALEDRAVVAPQRRTELDSALESLSPKKWLDDKVSSGPSG